MRDVCIEWCHRLKAVNRYVTGCQYRGKFKQVQQIKNGKYGDCLFFKGEDVVAGQIEDAEDDRKYYCLSFTKSTPVDYSLTKHHRQIYPVDRAYNTRSDETGLDSSAWVLLRLPENDEIKTQVRQIRINLDRGILREGVRLEVFN